jgi:hypothetical protein
MLEVYLLKDGLNIVRIWLLVFKWKGPLYQKWGITKIMLKEINKYFNLHLTSHSQVVHVAPPASKTAPSKFFVANYKLSYLFS